MALLRHCQTRFSTGKKHVLPPDPISTPTASCSTRSSLPHIYDNLPVPSPSSSLRPGLTGQDAEPEPLRVPSVSRKLGSRYSPLNLFGKAGESVGNARHRAQYPRITTNASPSRSWHYPLAPLNRVCFIYRLRPLSRTVGHTAYPFPIHNSLLDRLWLRHSTTHLR
jgi:hypothetical protein